MVKRLCHIPYYKDSSQKMKSIFGLKPLHGTQVRSDDYSVIIERVWKVSLILLCIECF